MMNKFKFGDRVRHPKYGECMVVTQWYEKDMDEATATIISEKYGECDVPNVELELIPHPDTARLDYIQKNFSEIRVCEDEDERFFTLHEDGEDWLKIGRVNVRELIDMAIAEQSE